MQTERVPLTFAKDTHLNRNLLIGRRLDKEYKRVLELLFARFGEPDDEMITAAIGHMIHPLQDWDQQLKQARDYQRQAQCHTLSWATQAMDTLVKNTGGLRVWDDATNKQRRRTIRALFDQAR